MNMTETEYAIVTNKTVLQCIAVMLADIMAVEDHTYGPTSKQRQAIYVAVNDALTSTFAKVGKFTDEGL